MLFYESLLRNQLWWQVQRFSQPLKLNQLLHQPFLLMNLRMSQLMSQHTNQLMSQLMNQLMSQPMNQPMSQLMSQRMSQHTNQLMSQLMNQPMSLLRSQLMVIKNLFLCLVGERKVSNKKKRKWEIEVLQPILDNFLTEKLYSAFKNYFAFLLNFLQKNHFELRLYFFSWETILQTKSFAQF